MSQPTRSTLVEWDKQHVWHPFTPHSVYSDEDPLMIVAAEGHTLIDADGRRWVRPAGVSRALFRSRTLLWRSSFGSLTT